MRFFNVFSNASEFYNGPLRPNCLMTRYPIIFVEKPKPFFQNLWKSKLSNLKQPSLTGLNPQNSSLILIWKDIPSFTAEHGYEVHRLKIHDLGQQASQDFMVENLKTFNSPIHIICQFDLNHFPKLENEFRLHNILGTWTTFIPHSFNYNLWLDHLILLAEMDHSLKNKVCNLQKMKFNPF